MFNAIGGMSSIEEINSSTATFPSKVESFRNALKSVTGLKNMFDFGEINNSMELQF